MQCRNCGTEIADKAIICFRCGQGTADPVRKPVAVRPRATAWGFVAPAVALLLSLVVLMMASASSNPGAMRTAAGVLAAVGALLLIVRLVRRR